MWIENCFVVSLSIKHLAKTINMSSISFHLPSCKIVGLISYQFAIILIKTSNILYLTAELHPLWNGGYFNKKQWPWMMDQDQNQDQNQLYLDQLEEPNQNHNHTINCYFCVVKPNFSRLLCLSHLDMRRRKNTWVIFWNGSNIRRRIMRLGSWCSTKANSFVRSLTSISYSM